MRIGWVAIGNENTGSTRNFVINTHIYLKKIGLDSFILSLNPYYFPDILNDINKIKTSIITNNLTHVIFQKVLGPKAKELVKFCKENYIKTIYNNGDWYYEDFYKEFDLIFVGSSYIKNILINEYKLKNVEIMYDMLETSTSFFKNHINKEKLTLGWFGNKGKILEFSSFINKLSLPFSYEVISISNTLPTDKIRATIEMGDGTAAPWDIDLLYKILYTSVDILILPINITEENKKIQYAKTANRLFPALQIGIPVVCTPIPSYTEVITNGVNGVLCSNIEEWKEQLFNLKKIELRNSLAKKGIEIITKFYPEKIVNYFLEKIK
jgi:glycosyltransferase involved in cell wall biosynthesis